MTPAACLREGKGRIAEPEKWGKGPNLRGDECAYIALNQAGYLKPGHGDALRIFRSVIAPATTSLDSVSIIAWNDAPERTHAEVMAAFDKAIELAEHGR